MQLTRTPLAIRPLLFTISVLVLLMLVLNHRPGADTWRATVRNGRFTLHIPPTAGSPLQLQQTDAHLSVITPTERITVAVDPRHDLVLIAPGNLTVDAVAVTSNLQLHADAITLHEATVRSAGDLTLRANTLTLRDSAERPLYLQSGGALTLRGDSLLDISALNHPDSGIVSGDAMRLVSKRPVQGDAHYTAGGPFQIAHVNGRANDLHSPNDPIILANGDVALGNYSGASLHIVAGGSVTLATVTITGSDSGANTINPGNSATFNGTDSYADLARVRLSNGTTLTVNGRTRPTLDVRAGVDWSSFAARPGNQVIPNGAVTPTFTAVSSANINISGAVSVTQPDGLVLLTNQYRPNAALNGTITATDISVGTTQAGEDAGDIVIDSRQAISSGALDAATLVSGSGVTAGNGGNITALAANGSIATSGSVQTFSQVPVNQSGSVENGGDILLVASDNISINGGSGDLFAFAFANSDGAAGSGGDVTVLTTGGDILARSVRSDTFSPEETSAGSGGDVLLRADSGAITLNGDFFSAVRTSVLTFGSGGNGGDITIEAAGDIDLSGKAIRANVSGDGGNGGSVTITTLSGDLTLGEVRANAATSDAPGSGGAVFLRTNSGNIETQDVLTFSNAFFLNNPSQNGGDITIETNSGSLTLGAVQSHSEARGEFGDTGSGGNITLSASQVINTSGAVQSYALAAVNNSNSGDASDGGTITITAPGGIQIGGAVEAYARSTGNNGRASSGGAIVLSAVNGPITTNGDIASDASATGFPGFDVENGGAIMLNAGTGIDTGNGALLSTARSTEGTVGDGGTVSAITSSGDIRLKEVNSAASNPFADFSGGTGSAGSVLLQTGNGRIDIAPTSPSSFTTSVNASAFGPDSIGNGGSITIEATQGIAAGGLISSRALGDAGNGGPITLITTAGDIIVQNVQADAIDNNSTPGSAGTIVLQTGNGSIEADDVTAVSLALLIHNAVQDGGDILIDATGGSVSTGEIASYAEARGRQGHTGSAGSITVNSDGDLTTTGPVKAYAHAAINNSNSGRAGAGGDIALHASGVLSVTGGVTSYSAAPGPNGRASDAGDVTLYSDGALRLGFVDARSRSATGAIGDGGTVQLRSATSVQLFGSPFDVSDSVSAAGLANSSAISLTHGAAVPFTVGDPATNGTAGGLNSGDATIAPTRAFPGFFAEPPNIWILAEDLAAVALSKTALPSSAEPGETVRFVLTYSNVGTGLARNVRITDTLPLELLNPTFVSSSPVTVVAGDPYVWDVGDLPVGASGTITVSAQLAVPLPAGLAISNVATVGTASVELALGDNSAEATLQTRNAPPNAVDDHAQTDLETAVSLNVLANDTDRNGDALTLQSVGSPDNGVVSSAGGTVTYTPNPGFSGEDSFVYVVSDGVDTSEATVTISVREGSDPVVFTSTLFLPLVPRDFIPPPPQEER